MIPVIRYVPYGHMTRFHTKNPGGMRAFVPSYMRDDPTCAWPQFDGRTDGPADGSRLGFVADDDRFLQEKADKLAQEGLGEFQVRSVRGVAVVFEGDVERGRQIKSWTSGLLMCDVLYNRPIAKWHAGLSARPVPQSSKSRTFPGKWLIYYIILYSFLNHFEKSGRPLV